MSRKRKPNRWLMKLSLASADREMLEIFYRVVRDNHAEVEVRVEQKITEIRQKKVETEGVS